MARWKRLDTKPETTLRDGSVRPETGLGGNPKQEYRCSLRLHAIPPWLA